MNGYAIKKLNSKNLLYINGNPQTHGNIERFIKALDSPYLVQIVSLRNIPMTKKFL